MKRVITTLGCICMLCLSSAFAQKINGIALKNFNEEYIEIENAPGSIDNFQITIDYGQKKNTWNSKVETLMDDENKPLQFRSMMGALNFLYKYGYELVTVNQPNSKDVTIQRFILRKKKSDAK